MTGKKRLVTVMLLGVALGYPGRANAGQAPPQGGESSWAKANVRADPAPKAITRGLHYVVSDERRHDLFRPDIQNKGGAFIGVGTNQNYVMAAWAKAESLIIVDFDQVIVDLHLAYQAAFLDAQTPEAFLDFWSPKRKHVRHSLKTLRAHYPKGPIRQRAITTFKTYRQNIHWGLSQVQKRSAEFGYPTFLNTLSQYQHLVRLFQNQRVIVVRGDFTGRKTLADIGRLLQDQGQHLGVLYLSNIEQYFRWSKGRFRSNMLGLPMDEHTVVLRAYGFGRYQTADHNYRYYVQSGENFKKWMQAKHIRHVRRLLGKGEKTETKGFLRLQAQPPEKRRRS